MSAAPAGGYGGRHRTGRAGAIDREQRRRLRAALYGGDGRQLVALVQAERLLDEGGALQLIGDGLVAALADRVDGADEAAARCAARLRERGWPGDGELADQIEAHLGTRPTPALRPLPVDLDELAEVLEGDPSSDGGRIDLQTGAVVDDSTVEYLTEIGAEPDAEDEDPDRWLRVWCQGSDAAYRDMVDFIDALLDPDLADRLRIAIRGRGAFRRFADVLSRSPDEFGTWHVFSDERRRGRARAWLAAAGYCVAARRPRPSAG